MQKMTELERIWILENCKGDKIQAATLAAHYTYLAGTKKTHSELNSNGYLSSHRHNWFNGFDPDDLEDLDEAITAGQEEAERVLYQEENNKK